MNDVQDAVRLPARNMWTWLPIIAAVAVLVATVAWFTSHAVRTHHDVVVDRAIAAERGLPHQPGPSAHVRLTPPSGPEPFKTWSGILDDGRELDLPRAVETALERYGHRATPLRAENYRAWRKTLRERREFVIEHGDLLVLRTLTDSDDVLRGVELFVRADTHRVVIVRLLARDYRVELTPPIALDETSRD